MMLRHRGDTSAAPVFSDFFAVLVLLCPMLFTALDVDSRFGYAGKSASGQIVDGVRTFVVCWGNGVDAGDVPRLDFIEHFLAHRAL